MALLDWRIAMSALSTRRGANRRKRSRRDSRPDSVNKLLAAPVACSILRIDLERIRWRIYEKGVGCLPLDVSFLLWVFADEDHRTTRGNVMTDWVEG